jgi:hypothetical protein
VAADGGNPDPTTTHGKRVAEAKAIEAKGWDYPKHLAGRTYGVVVHGDVAGVEVHRRNVTRAVVQAVKELRARRLSQPDRLTKAPRAK